MNLSLLYTSRHFTSRPLGIGYVTAVGVEGGVMFCMNYWKAFLAVYGFYHGLFEDGEVVVECSKSSKALIFKVGLGRDWCLSALCT